ncbi:MAG: AsmA family protein [Alphaproteobacteria bacterium]|nr:AsmA family protein [Alphaproteobacteria bacterium]
MKTFLKISVGIVIVAVIGLFGVYMGRNALIKHSVEKVAPKYLQTSVTLEEVDFQPFQGHVMLKNLRIENPKGFSENDLFSLGLITVDLQPKTLLSNKIIINKILIDTVAARYEIANGTNNIAVIQKNVAGKPKQNAQKASPSSDKTNDKPAKSVIIKDFTLKDATVSASVSGVSMTLPLPTIHMTGIGEDKPSTLKEAFTSIINVFSAETLNAIANATAEALKSGADSLGKILKQLF